MLPPFAAVSSLAEPPSSAPRLPRLDAGPGLTRATVAPEDQIGSAIQLMRAKAVRRLPVVEAGRLVGILSIGDLDIERDRESALAAISSARPSQ